MAATQPDQATETAGTGQRRQQEDLAWRDAPVRERIVHAKFDGLAAPYLSASRRDAIASALLTLDQAQDIGAVLRLTRPEPSGAQRAAA